MRSCVPSIEADRYLPFATTACSRDAGWRSLLLRAYDQPAVVQEFTTPPTADQLVVLITGGTCEIEARSGGRWRGARYRAGSLGMTRPGEETTLRWRGPGRFGALHLHLPQRAIREAMAELPGRRRGAPDLPNDLVVDDPLVREVLLSLADAMAEGAPDLYAETSARLLAAHLLVRHGGHRPPAGMPRADARLRRVEALMRGNRGEALTLAAMAMAMAVEAGVSRIHLLRLFKRAYGETPFKRLTRLRLEEAQRRLVRGRDPVIEIALSCGYDNPAHFARAFRRTVGVTPSAYRSGGRRALRAESRAEKGNFAVVSDDPAGEPPSGRS